jgi:hypothetical protein
MKEAVSWSYLLGGSQQLASLTIDEVQPRACWTGHPFELSCLRILVVQPNLNVLIGYRAFEDGWLNSHPAIIRDGRSSMLISRNNIVSVVFRPQL